MRVEDIPIDFVVIEGGVEKCITVAPAVRAEAGWKLTVRFLDGTEGFRFFRLGTEIDGEPCGTNKGRIRRWKMMS